MDKLPDANRAADPDDTASFLNETVIDLLKQNRGSSETEKKKCGKRVPKKYKQLFLGRFWKPLMHLTMKTILLKI